MKTVNKKTRIKLVFLIFMGALIAFLLYMQLTSSNKVEESTEEIASDDEIKDVDEDYLDDIEEKYTSKEVDDEDVDEPIFDGGESNDPDADDLAESKEVENYYDYYTEKYSSKLVSDLETKSEDIVRLLFQDGVSKKEWLGYIDEKVYKSTIKEKDGLSLNKFEGQNFDSITLSPMAHVKENEVMFEVMVNWSYGAEDEQTSLIYIVYDATNTKKIAIELSIV